MFAVIKTGGKQYKVQEGDVICVELMDGQKVGSPATFSEVLMVSNGKETKVGSPLLSGASVRADVLEEVKGDKVVAFKFRRRKGYHRTVGHRQRYLKVKIGKIQA